MKQDNIGNIGNVKACYKDFPGKDSVTPKEFSLIIKTFFANLLNSIITTGIWYKIPYGIGVWGATKMKNKIQLVDWKTTREEEERTYFSGPLKLGGMIPKLKWNKTRAYGGRFTFTDIWRIRWNRVAKRSLHKEASENNAIIKYY